MAQQRRVSRALQTFTFGIWGMKEVPGGQTGLYLGAQIPPSLAAQPAIVARVSFSRRTRKSCLFVLEQSSPLAFKSEFPCREVYFHEGSADQ